MQYLQIYGEALGGIINIKMRATIRRPRLCQHALAQPPHNVGMEIGEALICALVTNEFAGNSYRQISAQRSVVTASIILRGRVIETPFSPARKSFFRKSPTHTHFPPLTTHPSC